MQCIIVVFPDHTHLLYCLMFYPSSKVVCDVFVEVAKLCVMFCPSAKPLHDVVSE